MAQMGTAGDDRLRLHLRVADNAGPGTSLEEWMSSVAAELTRQRTDIDQLGRQSAEIREEISALKSSSSESRLFAKSLRGDSADLKQRMDDLDRRLNKLLALFEKHFGGGQTEQGIQHHDYAAEYLALVEQKIVGLAHDVLRGGIQATPREKAEFVATVCAGLFGTPEVPEQRLIRLLPEAAPAQAIQRMGEICAEARGLRAKVANGRPQHWEFECEVGVPVREDWQEPWAGTTPGGMVEFVVVPAYFVDSSVLLQKQKVFTSEPGPAPRDAGPAEG
jgi:hypothetical protein